MVFKKILFFFIIWGLLSNELDFFHLSLGMASSLAVVLLNTQISQKARSGFSIFRFLLYIPWLLYKILSANVHVALLILNPKLPISPRLIKYKTNLHEDAAKVTLGNSITLTPGTITANIEDDTLTVHAIDKISYSNITEGILENKIKTIFFNK